MKTLIVLISLLATTTFAAQDFDNVTEVSHKVAEISSVNQEIASVSLNNSGVLVVRKYDKSIKTLKLADLNKMDMLYAAQALSEAELQEENFQMVCAMIVDPRSVQNLNVFDTNTQKMKMVLSHRSCAIGFVVYPKEQHAAEAALVLKTQMITLALQLAAQSK
jgi:hypothetical protein